jgi:lipopolysaccharide transport protein LptA
MKIIKSTIASILFLSSLSVFADDHREVNIKIDKEISVFSDSAIISFKEGKYEFGGKVVFSKNEDIVESEKLIIFKGKDGEISLIASGGMIGEVKFKFGGHIGRGKVVEYDKKSGKLVITGDGYLEGEGLNITSDRIYYNILSERLESGKFNDQFNRVKMKIKL